MTKNTNSGPERFQMTKKRHYATFSDAVKTGKADPAAIPICEFLNNQAEFFTASSCSGRIILLNVDSMEQKQPGAFLYKTHDKADAKTGWKKLAEQTRTEVWFKQESFILHIGTNSLGNANKILECARTAGIKRGGIMVAKPGKFLLELLGTQGISLPVKQKNKILVSEDYFRFLTKTANKKLAKNAQQLKKFEETLASQL